MRNPFRYIYGNNNGNSDVVFPAAFPSNSLSNDAATYFTRVIEFSTTGESLLSLLNGDIALYMQNQNDSEIASLYLQAVGENIMIAIEANEIAVGTTTAVDDEILVALQHAATICSTDNKEAFEKSSIILALSKIIQQNVNNNNNNNNNNDGNNGTTPLSLVHIVFVQCGLYAGQHRFVQRIIDKEWPCLPLTKSSGSNDYPNGSNTRETDDNKMTIDHVLNYYYCRGMIHYMCGNLKMAIRSFTTCVTVPCDDNFNDASSVIMMAWKKLILCQCLIMNNLPKSFVPSSTVIRKQEGKQEQHLPSFLSIPTGASKSIIRLLGILPFETLSSDEEKVEIVHCEETIRKQEDEDNLNEGFGSICSYYDLLSAFHIGDRENFNKIVVNNGTLWQLDSNNEMISQLGTKLVQNDFRRLSRIYSSVSINQLATDLFGIAVNTGKISIDSAKLQVQQLLLQSKLSDTTNSKFNIEPDGMVSFVHKYDDHNITDEQLTSNLQQTFSLAETIRALDITVATNKMKVDTANKSIPSSHKDYEMYGGFDHDNEVLDM